MDNGFSVSAPPASGLVFRNGIRHPDLWLWDAWTCRASDELSLFTLALARAHIDGSAIPPGARNNFQFHIRRFASCDDGIAWRDRGAYLAPSDAANGVLSRNVWSGGAAPFRNQLLFGFTGVRQPSPDRPFVQTICGVRAPLDFSPPGPKDIFVISDPVADYDVIRAKGYYLGPRDKIGDTKGEDGGPILAWRDPFFLVRSDNVVDAIWSAKIGPTKPAIAHARLDWRKDGFHVDLLPPILLPDSDTFTQAEVPKVYHDTVRNVFYMLVSTCNRLHEGQPDSEVSKMLRLYVSDALNGEWRPYRSDGSSVPGVDGLFGASLTDCDFDAGTATLIGPYTETGDANIQLTFAPPQIISLTAPHD